MLRRSVRVCCARGLGHCDGVVGFALSLYTPFGTVLYGLVQAVRDSKSYHVLPAIARTSIIVSYG